MLSRLPRGRRRDATRSGDPLRLSWPRRAPAAGFSNQGARCACRRPTATRRAAHRDGRQRQSTSCRRGRGARGQSARAAATRFQRPATNRSRPEDANGAGPHTRTAQIASWSLSALSMRLGPHPQALSRRDFARRSGRRRYLLTSITAVDVRPNTSGEYISSARAGAVRNEPAVVARTMYVNSCRPSLRRVAKS